MKQTYYAFPGDAGLSYDPLWRACVGWLVFAEYARGAAEGCDIAVTPSLLERWFRLGGYAYFLDDLIDEQPRNDQSRRAQACEIYARLVRGEHLSRDNVPDWVNLDLLGTSHLFYNARATHNASVGHPSPELTGLFLEFLDYARAKAAERRVWRYCALLVREGRLLGRLIAECLELENISRRDRRRQRFVRWFGDFSAGGNLFDACRDLTVDFQEGRTQVKPMLLHRLIIFGCSAAMGAKLALNPRIFWSTLLGFSQFWGFPLKREEDWGKQGAAWQAKAHAVSV